jgi:OCT family organic cation transporter-like MFS transporter 4/5
MAVPSASSLAAEITPSRLRAWVLNLVWIFFPVGEIFAIIIARSVLHSPQGWRYLMGFAAIPSLISFIISFFIFESPRFYLAHKRYEKCFNGLNRMLRFQNKPELTEEIKNDIKINYEEDNKVHIRTQFKSLMTKKYRGLTFKTCVIFFCCSFVYYGAVYILPQAMSAEDMKSKQVQTEEEELESDSFYTGLIFSALAEIPSTLATGYLANIKFLGRKGSMGYGFIFTGVSAIFCGLFLNHLFLLASLLKFAIDIPFGVIYIYVSEAFPTKIRSLALGFSNSCNRLGGFTTPLLAQVAYQASHSFPFYIFGVISFLGAIFSFILPFETLNKTIV